MKTIVTPFQTTDPNAGNVKRSNEYSTPTTTPAEVSRSTVGISVRIIATPRSNSEASPAIVGKKTRITSGATTISTTTMAPTTTITKVSSFDASA